MARAKTKPRGVLRESPTDEDRQTVGPVKELKEADALLAEKEVHPAPTDRKTASEAETETPPLRPQ